MKTELVQSLTSNFEACAQRADNGVEFWLARDLQHLLGYLEWRNFVAVVNKGKTACEVSGHTVADHFVDVTKMVNLEWNSLCFQVYCLTFIGKMLQYICTKKIETFIQSG